MNEENKKIVQALGLRHVRIYDKEIPRGGVYNIWNTLVSIMSSVERDWYVNNHMLIKTDMWWGWVDSDAVSETGTGDSI